MPSYPIRDEHARAFDLAVCERLGLDPAIVSGSSFHANAELVAGEEYGEVRVSFTAHLLAEDVRALMEVSLGRSPRVIDVEEQQP